MSYYVRTTTGQVFVYIKCKICKAVVTYGKVVSMFACPICVTPDTIILGDNKPISEYKDGDLCFSNSGLTKVRHITETEYKGNIYEIKANGILPFTITPEHPILTVTGNDIRSPKYHIDYTSPYWKNAMKLIPKHSSKSGDYLVIPITLGERENINSLSKLPFTNKRGLRFIKNNREWKLDRDLAWLLGLYVAEGNYSPKGSMFSLNIKEEFLQNEIKRISNKLGYSIYTHPRVGNAIQLSINSRILARALKLWCGDGARNKKIPEFILCHNDLLILASFLKGYFVGDGCSDKTIREHANSVSKILVLQLQSALARLKIFASLSINRKEDGIGNIMGRKVNLHKKWDISFRYKKAQTRNASKILSNYIITPITSITKKHYEGKVYNLQTEDNTFLVNNIIVHNCGSFDFNPKLVGKDEYLAFQRRNINIELAQKYLYNPKPAE